MTQLIRAPLYTPLRDISVLIHILHSFSVAVVGEDERNRHDSYPVSSYLCLCTYGNSPRRSSYVFPSCEAFVVVIEDLTVEAM